jgi:hypothetical protein
MLRATDRAEEDLAAELVRGVWTKVARDVATFRYHQERKLLNRCICVCSLTEVRTKVARDVATFRYHQERKLLNRCKLN